METVIVEIRAGEGGEDSRLFTKDMAKMYKSYCKSQGLSMEYL